MIQGRERPYDEERRELRNDGDVYSPSTSTFAARSSERTPTQASYSYYSPRVAVPPPMASRSTGSLVRPARNRSSIVNSVVGIRRTAPSPGADALVFGTDVRNQHRGITDSLSTFTSGVDEMPPMDQLDFPTPPMRPISAGLRSSFSEPFDMSDLPPPPLIPAAQSRLDGDEKHPSGISNLTRLDVTSFIEGEQEKRLELSFVRSG